MTNVENISLIQVKKQLKVRGEQMEVSNSVAKRISKLDGEEIIRAYRNSLDLFIKLNGNYSVTN